jgi:hypothetical protein
MITRVLRFLPFAFVIAAAPLFAEVKIAPYYSLTLREGAAMPNRGDWMFDLNLTNDMGLIVQPSEAHRFFGFYELKYDGPGLKRQEGEKFTDRAIDHVVVLRHHYTFGGNYTLKSQLDYMKELKRTGTNEVWGKGLYDFDRVGLGLTLERAFDSGFSAGITQELHTLSFPNYTDLLSEIRAGDSAESSTGKQNHNVSRTGLSVSYGATRLNVDITLMSYLKQKVISASVQPGGSYYSNTLQQDTIFQIGVRHDRRLGKVLVFSPQASLKLKSSNQNYQHFDVATATVPVRYVADYYDYTQYSVGAPVSLFLSKRWEFYVSPEWEWKMYAHRPPMDAQNNFLSGTQANNLFIFSSGLTLRSSEVTSTTFFYAYQSQSSNMKFEKYFPYNYSGSYFGINFNYTY